MIHEKTRSKKSRDTVPLTSVPFRPTTGYIQNLSLIETNQFTVYVRNKISSFLSYRPLQHSPFVTQLSLI
jgi:hypothetical protein